MAKEWGRLLDAQVDRRTFVKGAVGLVLGGEVFNRVQQVEAKEVMRSVDVKTLMFHEVSYAGFRSVIQQELANGRTPVTQEDLIRHQMGEITLPNIPYLHPTLDDGLFSQLQAVQAVDDIQKDTGIFVPMTFFSIMQFLQLEAPVEWLPDETPSYSDRGFHRYMTKGNLIELIQKGHAVENHTVNHPDPLVGGLPGLTASAARAEIADGQTKTDILWKLAGKEHLYKTFAYPEGLFDRRTLLLMKELGYHLAYATDNGIRDPEFESLALTRVRKS